MGMLNDIVQAFGMLFSGRTPTEELPKDLSFKGKSVLITGATSGLGFETAVHYVKLGAFKVIITARSKAKGEKAKQEIEKRTGKMGILQVMVLDMDSFDGVKSFVKDLEKTVSRVDIVLLNAGVHDFEYILSPNGWYSDIQVNTLSTILLALLLIPWMRSIKKADQIQHLGFTSSTSHLMSDISTWPSTNVLKFLNTKEEFKNAFHAYENSKLLLEYAIQEVTALATNKNGKPDPIVNSVCPGRIRSNIGHAFAERNPLLVPVLKLWLWIGSNPTDVGARSLVKLGATKPEEHGKFKTPTMPVEELKEKTKPMIWSEEGKKMQKQVWKEVYEVLVATAPEVKDIVSR